MYLPTFWKLTTEATMYRARHMAGYGVPVTFLCNFLVEIYPSNLFSYLDHVPLTVQLGLLLHYPPQERCPQERLRLKVTIHTLHATSLLKSAKGAATVSQYFFRPRPHFHFVPQSGTRSFKRSGCP